KALPYYRTWWRAHKNMAFVPWQTAAYTEAYLQSRERPFAEFVEEMNDWLCSLQYSEIDRDLRRVLWYGGVLAFPGCGAPCGGAGDVPGACRAVTIGSGRRR